MNMKIGPVTKLNRRNKTTPKKFNDDAIFTNFNVIVVFTIYGQFGAICKSPNAQSVKLTVLLKVIFYLTKNGNRNKISLLQLLYYSSG